MVKLLGMINMFDVKKWRIPVNGDNFDNSNHEDEFKSFLIKWLEKLVEEFYNQKLNEFKKETAERVEGFREILKDICPDPRLCQAIMWVIMWIIQDFVDDFNTYKNKIVDNVKNNDFPDDPLLYVGNFDYLLDKKIDEVMDLLYENPYLYMENTDMEDPYPYMEDRDMEDRDMEDRDMEDTDMEDPYRYMEDTDMEDRDMEDRDMEDRDMEDTDMEDPYRYMEDTDMEDRDMEDPYPYMENTDMEDPDILSVRNSFSQFPNTAREDVVNSVTQFLEDFLDSYKKLYQ